MCRILNSLTSVHIILFCWQVYRLALGLIYMVTLQSLTLPAHAQTAGGHLSGPGINNPSVRIVIVGAGPSGAALANILSQHQLKNASLEVLILEQTDRIGGRSFSKVMTLPNGNKVSVNLGTQMNFNQLRQLLASS